MCKIGCRQGVEVVGNQQVMRSEDQKKEQSQVEFGIKQRAFFEQELHAVGLVTSRGKRQAFGTPATHQQYAVRMLLQSFAGAVDPLIGCQIVCDGHNGLQWYRLICPGAHRWITLLNQNPYPDSFSCLFSLKSNTDTENLNFKK